MKAKRPRKYSGFGVETRQGRLLWHYLRHDEEDTRQDYLRHNPQVDDHPDGHKIVAVKIETTPIEGDA